MCPQIYFLSACSLRLFSVVFFREFIWLRISIRREHHSSTEAASLHQDVDFHPVLAPTKAITSSLCPAQGRQTPLLWDAAVSCPPNTRTSCWCPSSPHHQQQANSQRSPAKSLKTPQERIQAQSRKPGAIFHQVAPSHYTFKALKKISNFYWISLYTAASLMNPHKS